MFDFLLAHASMAVFLAQGPPRWWTTGGFFVIMGVIILVMMVMPGRKQAKKRKEMMAGMSKNDRVLTRGGVIAVVMEVRETEVILKVDESNNIRMHFAKNAIQHVFADKNDIDPAKAEV